MGNKLKLKDALQAIGLLFSLITSFLGLMYILKGDIFISGLVGVVLLVCYYFLINEFVKSKVEITRNKLSTKSIILWVFYIALSIPSSSLLIHCFNVEINEKKNIQAIANLKCKNLEDMTSNYKSIVDKHVGELKMEYSNNLKFYLSAKQKEKSKYESILTSEPFNLSRPDLSQISNDNIELKANNFFSAKIALFNKVTDTMIVSNKNFLANYSPAFANWKRLKLNTAFYELDSLLSKNLVKLQNDFQKHSQQSDKKFHFAYSPESGLMDKPAELWNKNKPYWLTIFVLILNVLLLLPYLLEPKPGIYINDDEEIPGGIEIK